MSIFVDKKFDQMDWISQAVEPYEVHINNVLTKLPDFLVVQLNDIRFTNRGSNLQISKENILDNTLKQLAQAESWRHLSWDERHLIYNCHAFDAVDNLEIDLRKDSTSIPTIKLSKIKFCLEEEDAKQIIVTAINDTRHMHQQRLAKLPFVMELAKLFLSQSMIDLESSRSKGRYKMSVFKSLIYSEYVLPSNRLRSDRAAIGFTRLISSYITNGRESDLMEIMRIKMMMDNGQAIYEIGGNTDV